VLRPSRGLGCQTAKIISCLLSSFICLRQSRRLGCGLLFPPRLKAPNSPLHALSKPPPILDRFLVTPPRRFARTPLLRCTDWFPLRDARWHSHLPSCRFRIRFCRLRCAGRFSVRCSLRFHGANQQALACARAGVFTRQSGLPRGINAQNVRERAWAIHPTDARDACVL
jgi:hypothetical protein